MATASTRAAPTCAEHWRTPAVRWAATAPRRTAARRCGRSHLCSTGTRSPPPSPSHSPSRRNSGLHGGRGSGPSRTQSGESSPISARTTTGSASPTMAPARMASTPSPLTTTVGRRGRRPPARGAPSPARPVSARPAAAAAARAPSFATTSTSRTCSSTSRRRAGSRGERPHCSTASARSATGSRSVPATPGSTCGVAASGCATVGTASAPCASGSRAGSPSRCRAGPASPRLRACRGESAPGAPAAPSPARSRSSAS